MRTMNRRPLDRANSQAAIAVRRLPMCNGPVGDGAQTLHVVVSDDGAGFDVGTKHPGHLGLTTMAERAAAIDAEFSLTSAPGSGTTVSVSLPHCPAGQGEAGRSGR